MLNLGHRQAKLLLPATIQLVEISAPVVAAGSVNLLAPSSSLPGDVLIACVAHRNSSQYTLPSGWQYAAPPQFGGNSSATATSAIGSGFMAWAVKGVANDTYSFINANGNSVIGRIIAFRGVDTSNPIADNSSYTRSANSTGAYAADIGYPLNAEAGMYILSAFFGGCDCGFSAYATDGDNNDSKATMAELFDTLTTVNSDTTLAAGGLLTTTPILAFDCWATASVSSRHAAAAIVLRRALV